MALIDILSTFDQKPSKFKRQKRRPRDGPFCFFEIMGKSSNGPREQTSFRPSNYFVSTSSSTSSVWPLVKTPTVTNGEDTV